MRREAAARVFGCAAVLLSYPGEELAEDLSTVARAAGALPAGDARVAILAAAGDLSRRSPAEAAAAYVETFDLRGGASLYLTYYRHGDTRERGLALAALLEAYRSAGFELRPGELPDFLPALLELAAANPVGAAVLGEHRMALDALRLGLDGAARPGARPYAGVVTAVCEALPGPSRSAREALRRYRAAGPPSEQVGLEPFAPPEVLGGDWRPR